MKTLEERFWAKVDTSGGPTACWLWMAACRETGYGQFSIGDRRASPGRAHRVAWELTRGPIPEGMLVCHRCDTPPCCNPSHLFLGTPADTMRDAAAKGHVHRAPRAIRAERARRAAAAHPERHVRGGAVNHAKLTPADVRAIRAAEPGGYGFLVGLARRSGVSTHTILSVRLGRTWAHVR